MQAGTYFSEGEKNATLFFSFNFRILLASLHAASRAPCPCHSVSSWDRSSNFGAPGLRWWGSPGQIIPSEGLWSRMSAWRTTSFVNRTHRIGFRMSGLFHKTDEDFGNTQPNCRVFDEYTFTTGRPVLWWCSFFFKHSHSTFVTILFGPFAGLFFNLAMRIRALFPKSSSILRLAEQAYWRVPPFTKWVVATSFEVILARPSKHSATGTLASGTSGSRRICLILPHERTRRRSRLCQFCTLTDIVTETAIVSFRTLPVGFPLPTIS